MYQLTFMNLDTAQQIIIYTPSKHIAMYMFNHSPKGWVTVVDRLSTDTTGFVLENFDEIICKDYFYDSYVAETIGIAKDIMDKHCK